MYENIGVRVQVYFPVGANNTRYCFHTPVDFGRGGITYLNGKVKVDARSENLWEDRGTGSDRRDGRQAGDSILMDFCSDFNIGD